MMNNIERIIKSTDYEQFVDEIQKRINLELIKPFVNEDPIKIYGETRFRDGLRCIVTLLNNLEKEVISKK